jgi:hypothetical protein
VAGDFSTWSAQETETIRGCKLQLVQHIEARNEASPKGKLCNAHSVGSFPHTIIFSDEAIFYIKVKKLSP